MSCPDWQDLCRRHEVTLDDTPEWRSALEHLDDCTTCQADAPTFDPTLLFRRLPTFEVGGDDIASMKQAVASMRRGQTIEQRQRPRMRSWRNAAAFAAVLMGSLMLRGAGSMPSSAPNDDASDTRSAIAAPVTAEPNVMSDIDLRQIPLVETNDPNYGSIIQVVDDDISLVLVVPSGIDV